MTVSKSNNYVNRTIVYYNNELPALSSEQLREQQQYMTSGSYRFSQYTFGKIVNQLHNAVRFHKGSCRNGRLCSVIRNW